MGKILVSFDSLIDIDFGVIRVVDESFKDEDFFDIERLELDDYSLKGILRNNPSFNPLYPFVFQKYKNTDEDIDSLESIKSELISEYEDDVLRYSQETLLLNWLIVALSTDSGYNATIVCDSDKQKEFIIDKLKMITDTSKYEIYTADKKNIVIKDVYDMMYINHTDDIFKYDELSIKGIVIYIPDTLDNLDYGTYCSGEFMPNLKVTALFASNNEFTIYNKYPYDDQYFAYDFDVDEKDKG